MGFLALALTGCGGGSDSEKDPDPVNNTDPDPDPVVVVPPPAEEKYIDISAKTGGIVVVKVGEVAQITGISSYTSSSEPLTYDWSFANKPGSSRTELQNSTSATPSFVADVEGSYAIQLIVSAEGISSQRDVAFVMATLDGADISPFHANLSSNCSQCHTDDFSPIEAQSPTHPATSHLCQTCHTMQGFNIVTSIDHKEVIDECVKCHNGDLAVGKSDFHVETDQQCDECHNTEAFLDRLPDGSFDHTTITGGVCERCHDGKVATGKTPSPPHPDTNTQCIYCHTVESFEKYFVDHSGPDVVGKACSSCHGVGNVIGKSAADPAHPVTSVECNVCHTVLGFDLGGTFDHSVIDSISQPCASCHNDVNAIGIANVTDHPDVSGIDCAACHNTTDFKDYFVDHTSDQVIGKRCDSCHGVTAKGMDSNHMSVTTEDCAECHTPGTFSSGTFDHTSRDVTSCDTCHNGLVTTGKDLHHIPTTQQCSSCHDTVEFAGATFNHGDTDSGCASCHDGVTSIGFSNNHMPTTDDCSVCHKDTSEGGFATSVFNHAGITDNCANCHDGVIAITKPTGHVPTIDDCSVCHSDKTIPDGFKVSGFFDGKHQDIEIGCSGCHDGIVATGKNSSELGHVPTDQECNQCHTTQSFESPVFSHDGINDQCDSCHDGEHDAHGAIGKSTDHLDTDLDCGVCHNVTNEGFKPAYANHADPDVASLACQSCHNGTDATGKDNDHIVTTEDCSVCHKPGNFKVAEFDHTGIESDCASCHNGTNGSGKSSGHIDTTEDCSVCHTTSGFTIDTFDHEGITSNCAECHDGVIATGKIGNHVPTTEDCSVCHQITGFKIAEFDHHGIDDNCSFCHNGIQADGKSDNHVPTNQDCGVCHTTTGFEGTGYNHTGIEDGCSDCHNGVITTGLSEDHIPTPLDCHYCHATGNFSGGEFSHDGITEDCTSCHDGNITTGKPSVGHLETTEDCDACHTTVDFKNGTFNHAQQYLDQSSCASCHDNVITTGKSADHLPTSFDCGSCHKYTESFELTVIDHDVEAVTSVRCDTCHNGTDVIGKASPSEGHLATTEDCVECHSPSTFGDGTFDHAQIYLDQNTCTACHNDVISLGKPLDHVETTLDCGSCHNTSDFTEAAVDHTSPEVANATCLSCHNGTDTTGKSADHMATSDLCETCHTAGGDFANVNSVDHNEVFGACSECHNGDVAQGKSASHPITNAECDSCHDPDSGSFLFLNADGSYDHSNVDNECKFCHNGSIATGTSATTEDTPPGKHPVTNSECGNCHTTSTFADPYPDHTGPDVTGDGITCDSCHGVSADGEPAGHPVTNVDCDTCHSIETFSLGGIFNHNLIDDYTVQTCESCHNDSTTINAPAKSSFETHVDTALDCGVCHNTESFVGGYDHTGITENCSRCHGDVPGSDPEDIDATTEKPVGTHLLTTEDCSVCHTTESFSSGTFDHGSDYIDPPALCTDCHNGVISTSKSLHHIPTNPDSQNCADCHNTTDFADAIWTHAGIDTANCALCHDGDITTGLSDNHVPTTLDCSSCHDITNFDTFAGIDYGHQGIDSNNCAQCHDTGIATAKPQNHIPSLSECSTCHESTDSFAATVFLTAVHQDLTTGCEGCHIDQFLPAVIHVKAASHLPTTQDCFYCHTVAAITPSTFNHLDINTNCISCHNGDPDYVAVNARGKTDIPVHQNTNGDCYICHNKTNFSDAFVDHSGTDIEGVRCDSCHNGTNATGMDAKTNPAHIVLRDNDDCGLCHAAGGAFTPAEYDHTGITSDCASCHDGSYATGMSDTHITITASQDCSDCHDTSAFTIESFAHNGIDSNCVQCHDGITATGKGVNHLPTNLDCAVCHLTTVPDFGQPITFAHSGIDGYRCDDCHYSPGGATPKTSDHPSTTNDCGVCHSTDTFTGAFSHLDENGDPITEGCSVCHDGNTALGKSQDHPDTTLDCSFCHKDTSSFENGGWVHDENSVGICTTCHADDMGTSHFGTTEECDLCHSTDGWAPSTFVHPASIPSLDTRSNPPNQPYNPLDHYRSISCVRCHGDPVTAVIPDDVWPDLRYKPYCAGCHESDYDYGESHHNGIDRDKDCYGSCHRHSIEGTRFH